MKTIYFATGNAGKIMSLQSRMGPDITVEQIKLDIPEIQHSDVSEIVREKARIAYQLCGKPVLVQDSAFHISALAGFPGPYIKYVNETIGYAGLLKLMDGITDRSAYFKTTIGYADADGTIHVFENDISMGLIAMEPAESLSGRAWSGLWKIYIPSWSNGKTLAELSDDEIKQHEQQEDTGSEFYHFIKWISKV